MKLRIMQQGGGLIYTPFIPVAQDTTTTGSSKSSDNSEPKIDPLDKELISLMKEQNLLPSDIQQIYNRLIRYQQKTQSLSGFEGTDAYRSAIPGMLQIIGMVNEAKANKEKAKDVEQRMISENAGSDVALDNYGRMYVIEDGKMKTISISDFDPNKHHALSNSQVLDAREREIPFDNQILSGLRNMVGMSTISKEIDRMIKSIGTKEESQYIQLNDSNRKVLSAIAEGPDGIYKLTTKERSEGLQPAWKAIFDNLPKNMQDVLRANAAIAQTDYRTIIQDMVLRQTSTKFDPANYDASASKAAGAGGESDSGGDLKNLKEKTYVEQVITGSNFEWPTVIKFSILGNHSDIYALAQNTGVIQAGENGGKSVGYLPLDNLKNNTEVFVQGANQESVMFGNQIFDSAQQAAIMYDGSAMYRVNLPATEVNGEIVPNWKLIDLVDSISEKIDDSLGKEQIDRILKTYDQSLYWDDITKTIKSTNNHWFLTFSGIIGSDFVSGLDKDSPFLEELTGPSADMWHRRYDEAMKANGKAAASQGRFGWMSRTRLYRANIFTPITNPLAGSTEYYPAATRTNNMQTQRYNTERQQINEEFASGQRVTNW